MMAVRYKDETLSDMLPFDEALNIFLTNESAVALYKLQSQEEYSKLETLVESCNLNKRISNIEDQLKEMKLKNINSDLIYIPNEYEMTNLGIVIEPNKK